MTGRRYLVLRLSSGRALAVRPGVKISAEDLLGLSGDNPDRAFAQVDHNPNDPTVLGLKNLTASVWSASIAGGGQRRIEPGKSVKLDNDTQISFDAISAAVRLKGGVYELAVGAGAAIPLVEGRKLTARGLMGMRGAPPDAPAAEIVSNPKDPDVLGLKNLSGQIWQSLLPGGTAANVEHGKAVRLDSGTRITFGPANCQAVCSVDGAASTFRFPRPLLRPGFALLVCAAIGVVMLLADSRIHVPPVLSEMLIFAASLGASYTINSRRTRT